MSSFHLFDHDFHPVEESAESFERWLERHGSVWIPATMILVLAIYGYAIYSFLHGDASFLREGIPYAATDW